MAQLNIGDIKVGYRFKTLDVDDYKWYLTEIIEVKSNEFKVKDIDSRSIWQGMEWEITNEEITDTTLYKSL